MSLWGSNPINTVPGQGAQFGCFAYLSASADTTITTGDVWYPAEGTFVNNPCENFVAAAVNIPGIKYAHALTQNFIIAGQITFSSSLSSATISGSFKKNGILVEEAKTSLYAKNSNERYFLAGSFVVEMEQDDEIQMVLTSDLDNTVITVHQFLLSMMRFF